ncbi:CHAT domain-containing protein [Luteolibacter sp. Populi]|uniref:CHAT domain-containing protein n=1 Tax=Luteolibacter sp. Populi TaxID=3230487 RepID=UPI0034658349
MLSSLLRLLLLPACLLVAAADEAGDLAATETELEGVAAEWKAAWEKSGSSEDALNYGETLHGLGIVERGLGKLDEALPHLEEALQRLAAAGPSAQADALEALALTRQDLGAVAAAGEDLRKVVALRETLPPEQREPSLAQGRDHLALNLLIQGRYAEAGGLLEEALSGTPATDHLARARRLGYLGRYLHTLGSHSRAAAACREALALKFDDPELRLTLGSQLALAELRLGKLDEARSGMEKAAEKARELYHDPRVAFRAEPYLNNLGALDLSQGKAAEAAASFGESLKLLEAGGRKDDAALIRPLNNLGCAEQAAGDFKSAGLHLRRAAELQAKHLPRVHLRVAETARNLARNSLLAGESDAAAEIDRATGIGLELLDEMIRHGSEQERLNFLQRLDLVSLPCATGDARRIAQVLAATKARLLDAMLEEGTTTHAVAPAWETIQKTLKPGSAFVDACRYLSSDPEAEMRYGAIVLLPEGPPKWVPLGNAADLDRWLEAFRKRLGWRASELAGKKSPAPTLTLRSVLRSLYDGYWEAIARELPAGTEHVAFSPDGALHFLPLAALLDSSMQPLCTRHLQVVTVTSARDLAGTPSPLRLGSSPWTVFGVSEFPKSQQDPGEDRLLNLLAGLDSMPGTADEARRIREVAPRGSSFLRDGEATEAALVHLNPAPAVLHLGSHAFFLPGHQPAGGVMDFDENADLLYSGGLLLHAAAMRGPNSPMLSGTDDVLFPAEVAKLPLHGTRLVTLSSCESGAGTAVSGEGLLGLRRGFALAGAREIAVALWPVSDRSTPEFMERFYRLAVASDRPGQALWQCQREFLTTAEDEAGFEAAGTEIRPLRDEPEHTARNRRGDCGEEERLALAEGLGGPAVAGILGSADLGEEEKRE